MDERQNEAEDEATIRNLVESWAAAVRRKDFAGIRRFQRAAVENTDAGTLFTEPVDQQQSDRRVHRRNMRLRLNLALGAAALILSRARSSSSSLTSMVR